VKKLFFPIYSTQTTATVWKKPQVLVPKLNLTFIYSISNVEHKRNKKRVDSFSTLQPLCNKYSNRQSAQCNLFTLSIYLGSNERVHHMSVAFVRPPNCFIIMSIKKKFKRKRVERERKNPNKILAFLPFLLQKN